MNRLIIVALPCLFLSQAICVLTLSSQTTQQATINLTPHFPDTSSENIRAEWTPASTPSPATILTKPQAYRTWTFKETLSAPRDSWEAELLPYESEVAVRQLWYINGLDILATGYLSSRYDLPSDRLSTDRKVLILTDSETRSTLLNTFNRLADDLQREGWVVDFKGTPPTTTPKQLKQLIYNSWNDTVRGKLTHVFIVGDLPYATSGGFNFLGAVVPPDDHAEHGGAWAADAYYADVETSPGVDAEYQWTDSEVDIPLSTSAMRPENVNVPGDGKFDQSLIPTDLELCVGRVDMRRLKTFGVNDNNRKREIELIEKYLNRNHAYRIREFEPTKRALVEDNFGMFVHVQDGKTITEAFAASGWRSFSPIVGADSVFVGDWIADTNNQTRRSLQSHPSLFAYGCGGGQYDEIQWLGSTRDFEKNTLSAAFTLLFGSYFGDVWSDDNIMRAALAADGWVLTSGWSGRPHWFLHPMASGETIGDCQRLSANNTGEYIGATQYDPTTSEWSAYDKGLRGVNNLLLGDPTLTLQGPTLTGDLIITQNGTQESISLEWNRSQQHSDTTPGSRVGYIIESSSSLNTPFTFLKQIQPTSNSVVFAEISLPQFHSYVRVRPYFTSDGRLSPLVGRGLIQRWFTTDVKEDESFSDKQSLRGTIQIYNVLGILVATVENIESNDFKSLIDLGLQTGLYLLTDLNGNTNIIQLAR